MITTKNLTKTFNSRLAVSDLTWNVPRGSIYGLVGPNGAGKSTTFRLLLGLVSPDTGEACVDNLDVRDSGEAVRTLTAYVPDQKEICPEMRVGEFINFYTGFFTEESHERAERQLRAWHISLDRRMKGLSKGMRLKVLLSAVFARSPKLLLLDEPTDGLDTESTEEVLSLIAGMVASGDHTVVISSHRLDEIERICDRVGFLRAGRLSLSGELDDLRASCKAIDVDGTLPADTIRRWAEVHSASPLGGTLRVVTRREPSAVVERLSAFHPRNMTVHDLNLRQIYLTFCAQTEGVLP